MAVPAPAEHETGAAGGGERDELDEVVARCQKGDTRAFEVVYRLCSGSVHALCLRLCADAGEAEQLTQDVFVRAWQKLGSYEGRGSFRGWLRRLAVHVFYDHRRARKRRRRVVEPIPAQLAEDADPEARLGGWTAARPHSTAIDLERAIAALPEGARTVFVLHDVEGYRHREIADMLGVEVGTSKGQLHRARRLLRVLLDREAG
jgi:RNA polymerase sigma-70 factor (ECF subfamily)